MPTTTAMQHSGMLLMGEKGSDVILPNFLSLLLFLLHREKHAHDNIIPLFMIGRSNFVQGHPLLFCPC